MFKTTIYNAFNPPGEIEKQDITRFLYNHLEQFGDPPADIQRAIDYSIKAIGSFGGFTLILSHEDNILGACVVNQTGMSGYIPENILVYIATHRDHRGKGLGKLVMNKAIEQAKGDIALHVEANNPARYLYEKLGFTNPYLEMRLKK
ncbi:MAG: GNAT family N-acetyltransferase [Flavobacteriales bacterium]|nr:GNAT family N-acetyltransferase [Flavobacteriales bacterium]